MQVTPSAAYKFVGFHTTNTRSKTRVVNKNLNPDFNEQLTLLVDGTGDHER